MQPRAGHEAHTPHEHSEGLGLVNSVSLGPGFGPRLEARAYLLWAMTRWLMLKDKGRPVLAVEA